MVLALLLIMIASTLTVAPLAGAASSSVTGSNWWNSSYQFRRPVTITNGGSAPLVNQTVLLHLNFTGYDAEDSNAGIRLVDPSGGEIPSAVAGAQYSGLYLRSAYLVFLVNIPPKSSLLYYIYYGSAFQSVPSYRPVGPSTSITSGFVATTLEPTTRDSNSIRLEFGTVDSETIASAVSYTSSGTLQRYGPTSISPVPFSNDTGLVLAAQLNPQTSVSYEEVQAGSLQLTRIIVCSSTSVQTIDALSNTGEEVASAVNMTSMVGLNGLSNLGSSYSVYNSSSGLLYTQNPDAYFGVQESSPASSFAVGSTTSVTAEALTGQFSGSSSYSLAGAAGFTWQLGDLSPLGYTWISSAWGVALNLATLEGSLPAAPIGATVGNQESLNVATPTARTLWSNTFIFTNLAIPSTGLVLPLGLGGADLIPFASSVEGTYAYTVPPTPQQNPQAWTESTANQGNATAFASSQYYAFDLGASVQRIAGTVRNAASTATASSISIPSFAFKGTDAVLRIEYKASSTVLTGSLSSQDLFIAADLDPTLTNNFNESLVLPVSGSSTTIPQSGCPSSATVGTTFVKTTPSTFLIGDGTWRTLSVPLPASLPPSGFNLIIRSCLSTSPGFSGGLDLEVASVGIVLKGPVSEFVASTFSSAPPELTMSLLPQASLLTEGGITANLTGTLVTEMNSPIEWGSTSTFNGTIEAPQQAAVGNLAGGPSATTSQALFGGILLDSAVSNLTETSEIAGATANVSPGMGISLVSAPLRAGITSPESYTIGLLSEPVSVVVQDLDGNGVPGVKVIPSVDGRTVSNGSVTDSSGEVKFQLVPWTYQFNATYEGNQVGVIQLPGGAQKSATISANIFTVVMEIKDSRGGALSGAQVNLQFGNSSISGQTDSQGRFSFEAIPHSLYNITVGVGSGTYFSGQISSGTYNNEAVVITTSYFPPTLQYEIILLIAIVPIALIGAFVVARRLGKRQ